MPAMMGAAIAMSSAASTPGSVTYSAGFYLLVGSQLITWACGVLLWRRVRHAPSPPVMASSTARV